MSIHPRVYRACVAIANAILASATIAHADPSAIFTFAEGGPDGDVGQFTLGLSKTGDGTYAATSVTGSFTYDDGYGLQTSAYTGVEPGGVVYSHAGFVKYFDSNGVILDFIDPRFGPLQAREAYDYAGQEQNGRYTAAGLTGTLVGVDPTTSADILFGWQTPDQTRHYGELKVALSQLAPNQYLPTGITGTFDSQIITGLNLNYQNPDNTIYDLQQYQDIFDGQGVSFDYGDGKVANLYIGRDDVFEVADDAGTSSETSNDNYYHVTYGDTPYADINFNPGNYNHTPFSPSPAPEPASWALMIIGLGALGAAARRRRQVASDVGRRSIAATRLKTVTTTVLAMAALGCAGQVSATTVMFNYSDAIADFIAPVTGDYTIYAAGAAGAAGGNNIDIGTGIANTGGRGALVGGLFGLRAGDELYIAVGGAGQNGATQPGLPGFQYSSGAGGGGASRVTASPNALLLMAGGGGGGGDGPPFNGLDASLGRNGTTSGATAAATGGQGGGAGQGDRTYGVLEDGGGGGSGYASPGGDGAIFGGAGGVNFTGGQGGQHLGGDGGFGGGGGGGSVGEGGGGGGYSGGAGGDYVPGAGYNVGYGRSGGGGGHSTPAHCPCSLSPGSSPETASCPSNTRTRSPCHRRRRNRRLGR